MTWASLEPIRLLATAAGLMFEFMVIASLNISVIVAEALSIREHPVRGTLGASAVFVLLMVILVFAGPWATLSDYARCITPASAQCLPRDQVQHQTSHVSSPVQHG